MSRPLKRARADTTLSDSDTTFEAAQPDDKWTEGDFQLISSDDVLFHVPSYVLLATSEAFRDALEILDKEDKKVALTDETFETASTVRQFLDLATTSAVRLGKNQPSAANLALFLRKWECTALIKMLSCTMQDLAVCRESPFDAFVAGAILDDLEVCSRAVYCREVICAPKPYAINGNDGGTVWNPCNWGLVQWRAVPLAYAIALARAWELTKENREPMEYHFKKQLQVIKAAN